MASASAEARFNVSRKGYDQSEVDEHLAALDRELRDTASEVAEQTRRLESEQERSSALEQELNEARQHEDAVRLMLHEASKTRDAMLAEAEETLQAARREAEGEAHQITETALDTANEVVAEARHESMAILEAGRNVLRALEAEAAQRRVDLDAELQELVDRMNLMNTIYDELQATLKLVAETSIGELVEAQRSLTPLDLEVTPGRPSNDDDAFASDVTPVDVSARPVPSNPSLLDEGQHVSPDTSSPVVNGGVTASVEPVTPPRPRHELSQEDAPTVPGVSKRVPDADEAAVMESGNAQEDRLPQSGVNPEDAVEPALPRLGDALAREAHDAARALRTSFTS